MKRFLPYLFMFTVLVTGFSVFGPSLSAHAATPFDNPDVVEDLSVNTVACTKELTNTWFTDMETATSEDLSAYIDEANYYWGVVQTHYFTGAAWEDGFEFWAFKKSETPGFTFTEKSGVPPGYDYGKYVGIIPLGDFPTDYKTVSVKYGTSCTPSIGSAMGTFDWNVNGTYPGFSYRWSLMFAEHRGSETQTVKIFFMNIPFITPTDYEGETPPAGTEEETQQYPNIGYSVDSNFILQAQYLRNLDIPVEGNTGYNLGYSVYEADSEYVEGDLLDYKVRSFLAPYEYQLPSLGHYILKVSLQVTPPAAPRDDIGTATFKIYADGTLKIGSNTSLDCSEEGICEDIASDCSYYQDPFQQANCALQSQLNLGVINPSITAFKNLFLSLIVPIEPNCNIPLTNVDIIEGQTLPLSDLSEEACGTTENLHTAFPVISIAVNFALAMGLFLMVARIINRFLRKENNDLIEGV